MTTKAKPKTPTDARQYEVTTKVKCGCGAMMDTMGGGEWWCPKCKAEVVIPTHTQLQKKAKTPAEERVLRAAVRASKADVHVRSHFDPWSFADKWDACKEEEAARRNLNCAVRALERERAGKGGSR
jgi:hypothetical protein